MRRALHCIAIKSLWTAETWATIYLEEAQQIIDICIKVRDMRCHDLDESLVAHYRLDVHWRFDAFGELEDSRRYPCPPSTYSTGSCWNKRQYLCLSTRIRRIYYPPPTTREEWVCEFLSKKFADFFFTT